MIKRIALYTLMTIASTLLFNVESSSASSASTIGSPFDSGSTWYICQGYNGPITHQGTYALDITSAPNCDRNAPYGQNIRAPLDGTVAWYGPAAGSLCINTTDGRSIGLYHINSTLRSSNKVTRGQVVGSLGAPNTVANGGIPHLHLEMWSTPGCLTPSSNIPFNLNSRSRICGAPDLTAQGPDYFRNGTWSGLRFISEQCQQTSYDAVYRFWSPQNQHHFYTSNIQERDTVLANYPEKIWSYEGVAYYSSQNQLPGTVPVYRFWSNRLQGHFYTANPQEKDIVMTTYDQNTWKYEGVAYYSSQNQLPGTVPVYRFWSNRLQGHFYTANPQEKDHIITSYDSDTWRYEGVAYYAFTT